MSTKKTTQKAKPKTTTKKPAVKKPITKSANAKKTVAKKPTVVKAPTVRRPPSSPHPPQEIVNYLNGDLNQVKAVLEDYAAHLRSLDRRRLNGVGIKKQGFIDRCQKAEGLLARSLRYAQTPHINSWSFAIGKTPKLSGVAG